MIKPGYFILSIIPAQPDSYVVYRERERGDRHGKVLQLWRHGPRFSRRHDQVSAHPRPATA